MVHVSRTSPPPYMPERMSLFLRHARQTKLLGRENLPPETISKQLFIDAVVGAYLDGAARKVAEVIESDELGCQETSEQYRVAQDGYIAAMGGVAVALDVLRGSPVEDLADHTGPVSRQKAAAYVRMVAQGGATVIRQTVGDSADSLELTRQRIDALAPVTMPIQLPKQPKEPAPVSLPEQATPHTEALEDKAGMVRARLEQMRSEGLGDIRSTVVGLYEKGKIAHYTAQALLLLFGCETSYVPAADQKRARQHAAGSIQGRILEVIKPLHAETVTPRARIRRQHLQPGLRLMQACVGDMTKNIAPVPVDTVRSMLIRQHEYLSEAEVDGLLWCYLDSILRELYA